MGRIFGTAISVLTIGVVTKALAASGGVAAYGAYATVFAFLGVLAVVADGGLFLVFTRAAATLDDPAERALLKRILWVRLLSLCGAALLATALVTAARTSPLVRGGILLGVVGTGAQLFTQLLLGVFQKRLRMVPPALGEVVGRAVTLVLAVAAARLGGGVLAFVLVFVIGAVATLVWNLVAAARVLRAGGAAPARDSVPAVSTLLRDAWPLGLLLVCWLIVFRADSLLLSFLRPPEDLGWYALPYKVLESLLFFPAMVGGLLFPVLSRTAAGHEHRRAFTAALTAATGVFLLLAVPTVAVLFLLAPWVIAALGGPAFAPSVPVLRILSVALGALFFGNLYGNSAIALGAQRPLLVLAACLAVLNISVNLLVIPRYAFLGAAWTTLATEVLSAAGAAFLVSRRAPGSVFARQHWHTLRAAGVLVVGALLPLPLWGRVGAALAAYGGALWVLGVLTPGRVRELLRAQRVP